MKQLLINSESLENRIAVVEDGKLREYFVERNDGDRLVGSIYKSKIRNMEPSLQAAFVDIGAAKNAFLHYWDMIPASQDILEEQETGEAPPQTQKTSEKQQKKKTKKPQQQQRGGLIAKIRKRILGHEQKKTTDGTTENLPGHNRRKRSKKRPEVPVEDIPELFKQNSEVLVQVSKGPIGSKGARVTTNLSIAGRYLVLLPNSTHVGVSKRIEDRTERQRLRQALRKLRLPQGMGVICRTVAAGKDETLLQQDLDDLLAGWNEAERRVAHEKAPCCVYHEPSLVERVLRDVLTEDVDEIVADTREEFEEAQRTVKRMSREERVKVRHYQQAQPLFRKYRITQQIDSLFSRTVPLPSGGEICVDETEALIAIDINSGKNRAGKDHPETILNTNLEAAEEVARQLRLRDIGGLVVVDFIDMRDKQHQKQVYQAFRDGMSVDRARTKILPISQLGLVEMTRQRQGESLRGRHYMPCPYCEGRGLVKSATSISVEIQRRLQELLRKRKGQTQLRVMVHPQVLERLKNEDADLLRELEEEWNGELTFRADSGMHVEEYQVQNAKSGHPIG